MFIWKYNKRTGCWEKLRGVVDSEVSQLLHNFQKSKPDEFFIVSKIKPKKQ